MVIVLAFTLSWLQGRFDASDVKKAIAAAMAWKPDGARSLFDALAARGDGDPQCTGRIVSHLLGDIEVRCSMARRPQLEYHFRVLLDGKRPPRASNPEAEQLVAAMVHK
jgi:hypothetical protein